MSKKRKTVKHKKMNSRMEKYKEEKCMMATRRHPYTGDFGIAHGRRKTIESWIRKRPDLWTEIDHKTQTRIAGENIELPILGDEYRLDVPVSKRAYFTMEAVFDYLAKHSSLRVFFNSHVRKFYFSSDIDMFAIGDALEYATRKWLLSNGMKV